MNLLYLVFAQIYFPTYYNGLKNIAIFFGFKWSERDASGVQSIIWRHEWEKSQDTTYRQKLITYNSEDCEALELIANAVINLNSIKSAGTDTNVNDVVEVDSLKSLQTIWPKFSSQFKEFEQINKAARWNYQRDRVYVRTSTNIKRLTLKKQSPKKYSPSVTRVILYPEQTFCPNCNSEGKRRFRTTKVLHDLYIGRFSLRMIVAKYEYSVFWCSTCQARFGYPGEF